VSSVVSKAKAILKNPYLLGAQGFIAGALLLWAAPGDLQQSQAPASAAETRLVPRAS